MSIRLTKEEKTALKAKAQSAGVSRSELLRRAALDLPVRENPPVDVPVLIDEIRRVGSDIDQIHMIAVAQRLVDEPRLHRALIELTDLTERITEAYCLQEEHKWR